MKAYFEELVNEKKLSHAYFLEGDDGTFATWLVKRVLCLNPGATACDCINCRKVDSRNHPDVFMIEPDGTAIKVEQIRELHQKASMKSVEGNEQLFIIKDGDKMNVQASNALLKFLEEPKEKVHIFLTGHNKAALLATIQSRVQSIKIPKVSISLEREARNKGFQFKSLGLLEQIGCNMEHVEKYADVADSWIDLIVTTATSPLMESLMWAQKWDDVFADKEQKTLAIKLLQSYVKALFNEKKGLPHLWGNIPHYEWAELANWAKAVDEFTRAYYSNGKYTLQLEYFLQSVKR